MPARSNPFQKLIRLIHEHVARSTGAKVTVEESALLEEPSSGAKRETDILITVEVPSLTLRAAIECRDWQAPQDVTWIDELIGKYGRDKQVTVIAVSSSGFTSTAAAKAESSGIECRTLQQALDTDWPAEFIKIGLAYVTHTVVKAEFTMTFDPPLGRIPDASDEFVTSAGTRHTADEFNAELSQKAQIETRKLILGPGRRSVFKTLADLDRPHLVEIPASVREEIYLVRGDAKHRLLRFVYRAMLTATKEKAPVEHLRYPDALVSRVEGREPGDPSFTVIQGKDGTARVYKGPELDFVKEFSTADGMLSDEDA